MAQQGFVYEENTVKFLAPMGLCEKVFAGASHDKPDLTLLRGKESAGCELKITAASAGSLVLKHTNGKWGFNDTSDDPEKDFIAGIAKKVGLMKLIEKSWKTKPLKRTPVDATLKAQIGKMTPEQIYRRDQANFPDIIGSIPATAIEEYYNAKKTWYVNVGTHGFYLMGTKDPLGYNKRLAKIKMPAIPMFGKAAQAKRELITAPQHRIVECGHPSPLSARFFMGCRCFSKINAHLGEGGLAPMDWQLPDV